MSISLGDILLTVGADQSKLPGDLKSAEGTAMNWAGALAGGLGGIVAGGVAAVAAGGVALIGAAFASGNTMDSALDTIRIKTGATGDVLAGLGDNFKKVFGDVPTEAGPAAEVLSTLYSKAGLAGDALTGTSEKILESARLLKEDAAANSSSFARVMGDWSLTGDQAESALDRMFVASQQSGIGMGTLMEKVVQFGSPLRLMGFSLDESVAMFAKWEKEGVNSELVMGSLRIAAGKFADEGKPLAESLKTTFDSIKNNTDATAALSEGMEVFGARAGPDMVAAIREGRFSIEDMLKSMEGADGAIMDTAKATEDWGEKLKKFQNKATTALAPFGMAMMDVAGIALDQLGPALDWVSDVFTKQVSPGLEKVTEGLGKLFSGDVKAGFEAIFGPKAAGQILEVLGHLKNVFDGTIGKSLPKLQAAGEQLWKLIGPSVLASLDSLAKSAQEFFVGAFEKGAPFVAKLIDIFAEWITVYGPVAAQHFANIAAAIKFLVPIILGFFDVVAPLFAGLFEILLKVALFWVQIFTGDFPGALATLQSIVQIAFTAIGASIDAFIRWVVSWFGTNLEEVKKTWSSNFTQLGQIFSSIGRIISSAITTWWQGLLITWAGYLMQFVTAVSGISDDLYLAAQGIVDQIWAGIQAAWTFMTGPGSIGEKIQAIVDAVTGIGDTLYQAGQDIINNLWDGINAAFQTLLTNLQGLIDQLLALLPSGLGGEGVGGESLNLGGGPGPGSGGLSGALGGFVAGGLGSLAGASLSPAQQGNITYNVYHFHGPIYLKDWDSLKEPMKQRDLVFRKQG